MTRRNDRTTKAHYGLRVTLLREVDKRRPRTRDLSIDAESLVEAAQSGYL